MGQVKLRFPLRSGAFLSNSEAFLSARIGPEDCDTARGNLTCESGGMIRWIVRLIVVAVMGKFLNRYLATQRTPESRRQ